MADTLYDVGTIVNNHYHLIAKKTVSAYASADDSGSVIRSFKSGEDVGSVLSYIEHNDGLYWMFDDDNGGSYYVRHAVGLFDIQALTDQGAKTVAAETADKQVNSNPITKAVNDATNGISDVLMNALAKLGVPVLVGVGIVLVVPPLVGVLIRKIFN